MLPAVALVGRPNVGKSTLYNVLTRTRDAIVSDMPGVTRDRLYGVCRLAERPMVVVDTAGLTESEDVLAKGMAGQSWAAIAESDVVCLVVDARDGLLPDDREIVQRIRALGKRMVLVINKTDGLDPLDAQAEFSPLGIEATIGISAAHQRGITELLQAVLERLPPVETASEEAPDPKTIRLAIVGRPNVGKSTLVNRLLGEERVLAMDMPGTTRDAIRVPVERDGQKFLLIDTAGIRRKARVEEAVEKFSVIKALQAIEEANVVVVVLDAQQSYTEQDAHILGHVLESGRALVLAINKWDGLSVRERTQVKQRLDWGLDFAAFAKRIPISALHGSGLGELMAAVNLAHRSAMREFNTKELTEAINAAFEAYQPPLVRGRVAKLRYAHQGGRNPPRVVIHGSRLASLPDSYKRYLENYLRKRYRLSGTPVFLEFREGENPFAGRRNELTERQVRKRRRMLRHVKH